MRRLLRWLWNGLTLLSLVLCVAACALWVRSYWRMDDLSCGTAVGSWVVNSNRGRLVISSYVMLGDDPPPPEWRWYAGPSSSFADMVEGDGRRGLVWSDSDPDGRARAASVAGLEWGADDGPDPDDPYAVLASYAAWYVVVPHWMLAALTAAPVAARAAVALRRRRRDSRQRAGRCPACGYDLTGNESGTCPECGTAVPEGVKP